MMTARAHPAPSRGRTQHETPPLRDIAPKKGGAPKRGGLFFLTAAIGGVRVQTQDLTRRVDTLLPTLPGHGLPDRAVLIADANTGVDAGFGAANTTGVPNGTEIAASDLRHERVLGLLTPTDTGHSAYVDPAARQAMATSKPAAASAKPPYVDRKGAKPWCTPRTAYLHPRFTRQMFTFPMRSLLMHVRGGTG